MSSIDRVRDARRAVMADALARWQQRAATREKNRSELATGGAGAADSAGRVARLSAREAGFQQAASLRRQGLLPIGLERKMGPTLDFIDFAPSEAARSAGRPVARIVTLGGPGIEPEGFATGFLINPQLLITNFHVFPDALEATGKGANFGYEKTERGIQQGVTFELDPDSFFLCDQRLDYAIVAVQPHPAIGTLEADLGTIFLVEATPKILVGEPVQIIQYPEGKPKTYAVSNDKLLDILDEGFLQYETDTLEGSSGSPAFSKNWELVALHHASIPQMRGGEIVSVDDRVWTEDMGDAAVKWIANEGIRVSAIVKHLSQQTLPGPRQQAILAALLASTTDPVDDLARMRAPPDLTAESRPVLEFQPGPNPNDATTRPTMPGPSMLFTGPVTINIYGGAAPPTAAAPAPPPSAAATGQVAIERKLRFDPDYAHREGYDPRFLGVSVPTPGISAARLPEMVKNDDGSIKVLTYHHFELTMNRHRRLMMWSAVNVDYDPAKKSDAGRAAFGQDTWTPDPRIPEALQLEDADFYKPAGKIDRGHIVRREDNAWGKTSQEQEFANSDTFHWTNCTPQHEAFNRSDPGRGYAGMKGLWGDFENHVQESLADVDHRACILAGPVLDTEDPTVDFGKGPVQYPLLFWKIVCVTVSPKATRPKLIVFGFLLSQQSVTDRFGIERFGPGKFARYQASLANIEQVTGLLFDPSLHAADSMKDAPTPRRTIHSNADIRGLSDAIP